MAYTIHRFGSHNSWTFLKPVKWYQRPFKFLAQCQSIDILKQIEYEITLFDLRVRFVDGSPHVFHGTMDFGGLHKAGVYDDLEYLNTYGNDIAVRVILESNSEMADQTIQERDFNLLCQTLSQRYANITFFGGNRKYDWKRIHYFDSEDIPLRDRYSSTTQLFPFLPKWTRILDDWCPYIYARLRNHSDIEEFVSLDTKDVLFSDFVNIK